MQEAGDCILFFPCCVGAKSARMEIREEQIDT